MGRFKNVLPYFQDRILLVNEAPRLKVGVKGKSMSAGDFILYAFSEHKKNVKDPSKVKRERVLRIRYIISFPHCKRTCTLLATNSDQQVG